MGKLNITYEIVKLYLKGWSEWYVNYLCISLLFLSMVMVLFLYMFLGVSLLFMVFYYITIILLVMHISLGFINIINDYVYTSSVKSLYIVLVLLLSFRMLVECLL